MISKVEKKRKSHGPHSPPYKFDLKQVEYTLAKGVWSYGEALSSLDNFFGRSRTLDGQKLCTSLESQCSLEIKAQEKA